MRGKSLILFSNNIFPRLGEWFCADLITQKLHGIFSFPLISVRVYLELRIFFSLNIGQLLRGDPLSLDYFYYGGGGSWTSTVLNNVQLLRCFFWVFQFWRAAFFKNVFLLSKFSVTLAWTCAQNITHRHINIRVLYPSVCCG